MYSIMYYLCFALQFSEISGLEDKREEDYITTFICSFWDPLLNGGFGGWSTEGCELVNDDVSGTAFCECNHLTSFALLMVSGADLITTQSLMQFHKYVYTLLSY